MQTNSIDLTYPQGFRTDPKKAVKITYILVCHETKSSKKLTLKSLQGSGNLGNFATAVYGLKRAEGGDMVNLKVLKNRRSKNNGHAYLEKLCTEPYFHFEFQGIVDEPKSTEATIAESPLNNEVKEPVKTQPRKCTDEQIAEIRRLYKEGKKTINQLHNEYGLNARTVRKYLGLKH